MCSCFMGFDLHAEASASHIDNAQAATNYMDWKARLITDKEYEKAKGFVMEIRQKEREKER